MRQRNQILNEDRRKAILKAASQCFVKDGFHGTSMKDVCVVAGMSPGTLYHYFSSKTEIIAGIVANEAGITRQLLTPLHSGPMFLDALFDVLEIVAHEVTDDDLALHTEIAAEILREPQLRKQRQTFDRETLALITQSIARAQDRGEIDSQLKSDHAAKLVLAIIDGLLWHTTLDGVRNLKIYLPAVKQALARMLLEPEKTT
jgi:TetR/AcrR family transcriptional regulator, repressor for uid operon